MGIALSVVISATLGLQDSRLDKFIYPTAPQMTCPPIEIDVTDFPESKAWAETAEAILIRWYGPLTSMLATDGRDPITKELTGVAFKAPSKIRLVFKKEISAPAWASGGEITVSGKWITEHPDDLGMMVHELTHVIQQYPRNEVDTGWLTEGIADYIRWWKYEPELHATRGRTKPDFTKAKYTDAYRTTAVWLAWMSKKYDMRIVPCLDFKLRQGKNPMPVFIERTGKSADDLWQEFSKEMGG